MRKDNPFRQTRFEYEGIHLYYLPDEIMCLLEQPKAVYLIGTRGTGKTTLLQALSWHERLTNTYLQSTLGTNLFEHRYVGIYLKLAKRVPYHFQKWLKNDSRADTVFSLFIDLLWLEELANALANLCVTGPPNSQPIFNASFESEKAAVQGIFCQFPQLLDWMDASFEYTLKSLSELFKRMRSMLQTSSMTSTDISTVMGRYPSEQVGEFGRLVSASMSKFCNEHSLDGEPWYFKICIDEAEWFSEDHDRVLNTMVRLSEWPTFFVVSYVRARERSGDIWSTTNPAITLSEPDRSIIFLDRITKLDPSFFEGIARVRLSRATGIPNTPFDLQKLLGSLNINKLLLEIITRSKSPRASDWLEKAELLRRSDFWIHGYGQPLFIDDPSQADDAPPIYEAYQIEKLGLQRLLAVKPGAPGWDSVPQQKEQLRQKMIASYLCLCNELNRRDVIYAFAIMVKQMSDNCVRDFLNQMAEIFEERNCPVAEFLMGQVSILTQHKALVRTSENKRNNIPRSRSTFPNEVGKIIDCLGRVTMMLQSDYKDRSALTSYEKGLFVLQWDDTERSAALKRYINDGVESGFLHMQEESEKECVFRLHCSLAANYKFSYRGAYSRTRIFVHELEELLRLDDSLIESAANKIVARVCTSEDPNQVVLFDEFKT